MTNVTVQEAFDKWIEKHKKHFPQGISAMDKIMFASGYEAALSEIEKCEPVAEVRWRNGEMFAKFKTDFVEAGTKLYTSPISKED